MWFVLNSCFPTGSLELGYVSGRGCDQPGVTTWCWVSKELPRWQHLMGVVPTRWGNCVYCVSTGTGLSEAWAQPPLDFAPLLTELRVLRSQ